MNKLTDIAYLLSHAKDLLSYSIKIASYPGDHGFGYLDPRSGNFTTNFLNKIHNACFVESCLILLSILDDNDRYPSITVKRLPGFSNELYIKKYDAIIISKEYLEIKTLRDQVFAHQDINNHNNRRSHLRGEMINGVYITYTTKLINQIIELFMYYCESENITGYNVDVFFSGSKANSEIENILKKLDPECYSLNAE